MKTVMKEDVLLLKDEKPKTTGNRKEKKHRETEEFLFTFTHGVRRVHFKMKTAFHEAIGSIQRTSQETCFQAFRAVEKNILLISQTISISRISYHP